MELGECSCVVSGTEVISAEVSHPASSSVTNWYSLILCWNLIVYTCYSAWSYLSCQTIHASYSAWSDILSCQTICASYSVWLDILSYQIFIRSRILHECCWCCRSLMNVSIWCSPVCWWSWLLVRAWVAMNCRCVCLSVCLSVCLCMSICVSVCVVLSILWYLFKRIYLWKLPQPPCCWFLCQFSLGTFNMV